MSSISCLLSCGKDIYPRPLISSSLNFHSHLPSPFSSRPRPIISSSLIFHSHLLLPFPSVLACTVKHIQAIQSTCQTRNAFSTGEIANEEHTPARDDYDREDREVSGLPMMPGQHKHTEYLRRLFVRGKPFDDDKEFEEIQVADGQKLYQTPKPQVTITRTLIREMLEEINDLYATLGRWKDDRKNAWLLRIVPPDDPSEFGYWKAGVLCMHRLLIVVIPHHRSTRRYFSHIPVES